MNMISSMHSTASKHTHLPGQRASEKKLPTREPTAPAKKQKSLCMSKHLHYAHKNINISIYMRSNMNMLSSMHGTASKHTHLPGQRASEKKRSTREPTAPAKNKASA